MFTKIKRGVMCVVQKLSEDIRAVQKAILSCFLLCCLIVSCNTNKPEPVFHRSDQYQQQIEVLKGKAKPFLNSGNDSLSYYAGKIIELARAHQDTSLLIDGKLMLARYELRVSNYPVAMAMSLEALALSQASNLQKPLPEIYSIMGNSYKENEFYDGALSSAEKGLTAARSLNDTSKMIGAMLEYAMFTHSYSMLTKNDSVARVSLDLYLKGLQLAESSPKFERQTIAFLDNISQYYLLKKDYEKGIEYGREGARVAKKYNQIRSLTYAFNWLGEIYYYQGHHRKGMAYLDSALQFARELNWDYRVSEILGAKYQCYLHSGDIRNALVSFTESQSIRDSLQMLQNLKQVSQLQVQYETGKKDQEIAMLSDMNEQKKKETTWILIGLGIFVLLSVVTTFMYRTIRKRNSEINNSYEQINLQSEKLKLLLKELHHRVKNNLQIVSSLLSLQSNHLSDQKALLAMKTGQQRIEAMSLIHRSLYRDDNPNLVNMPEYVSALVTSVMSSFGKTENDIGLRMDIHVEELDVDIALPLGLVINEWTTNSFKYAFENVADPALYVSLKTTDQLLLEIGDNGPGMQAETWEQPSGSFGIKLIKVLNKQMGGHCSMCNQQGTKLNMIIPLKTLEHAV